MSRTGNTSHGQENAGSATDDFKGKASEVGKNLRDMTGHIGEVAREQYEGLRDRASDYYEQGREKAKEWQDSVEHYIYDKPMQSLLIAAGVGVLLGLWLRRR